MEERFWDGITLLDELLASTGSFTPVSGCPFTAIEN
jgi:hypothetical protein